MLLPLTYGGELYHDGGVGICCLFKAIPLKLGRIERIVVFKPKQFKNNFEVFQVIYSESASDKGALTAWIVDNIHGLCGHKTGDNAKEFQELGQVDIFAGASPSRHFQGEILTRHFCW